MMQMTTIPFDWIVLQALGLQQSNSTTAWYISLLRLLRLGRAYRLIDWVYGLTYNQTLNLVAFTLVRNFAVSCVLRRESIALTRCLCLHA
jgi:hypothetical protein